MNEVLLTAIVGVLTSLGTWFAARRKNLADTQTSELDNVEKAVKFYREQFEDIATKLQNQVAETDKVIQLHKEQAEETRKLNVQNKILIEENKALIEENKALIEELKKYKQLNGKKVTTDG